MPEHKQPQFNLDALLGEIPEDEQVCRTSPRILTQDDIRRLIDESRSRKQQTRLGASSHEE
jgi:hypothetical protein